jgi:hypothetical protein
MSKINLILAIILISSCKAATITARQSESLESVVVEKLGADAVIKKNKDTTFALCTKENPSTQSVSYLVIRLSDLTIVVQNKTSPASFLWIDTYLIEIKEIPGIVKKEEQNRDGKIIDVTKYIVQL